jgi:bromodomain adjacent to zinc finger domain protein 1A
MKKRIAVSCRPLLLPSLRLKFKDQELNANLKLPDARRSSRNKAGPGHDISQQPYMQWKNRRALTHNQ